MWFAVHTRSRSEKSVERALERQNIDHFLPLMDREREYAGRKRSVSHPLIPGYIFVRITFKDYLAVLQTKNVVDFVRFGSEINPIPQREIDILEQFCRDKQHTIILSNTRYHRGDQVVVTAGPLKGIQGTLIAAKGRRNLVVELRNVGHSLQVVQIESRYLKRLGLAVK
jgi:transcription antitermination factor NusG